MTSPLFTQISPSNKVLYGTLFLFGVIFLVFESNATGDLGLYCEAARALFNSKDIYHERFSDCSCLQYLSSPFWALSLTSLAYLPGSIGAWLWKLIQLFLLLGIWQNCIFLLDIDLTRSKRSALFTFLVFLSTSFLIYANFHFVQFTIFLLFLMLGSLRSSVEENPAKAGILLAIGIMVKLLPLVLIPYFIYRKDFKTVLYTFLFVASFLLIPALFIGWEQNMDLLKSWFFFMDPSRVEFSLEMGSRTEHGLGTLITSLLIADTGATNSLPIRNLLDLHPHIVYRIVLIGKLTLVAGTFFFLRGKPFTWEASKPNIMWVSSYILIVAALIFPLMQHYSFLLMFPAIFYLLAGQFDLRRRQKAEGSAIWRILLVLALVLINAELFLGQFREIYWHYKTMTYGALLIIALLYFASPTKNYVLAKEPSQ